MTIEGIDIKKGMAMVGGNAKAYTKILTKFCEDGESKTELINECFNQNDCKRYTIYVHAIKSAAANIGAYEISEAADKLEEAGHKNDWGFIAENNAEFLKSFTALLKNIEKALPQSKTKTPDAAATQALKDMLQRLKAAFADMDVDTIDEICESLDEYTNAEGIGEDIKALQQNAFLSQYDEGVEIIERLE